MGAEGTGPEGAAVVNSGVGVESSAAAGAEEGFIGEDGKVREGHQR